MGLVGLICEVVAGFLIIFGLIFVVGVVVFEVGAVVAGAWWINSLVDFCGLICLVWIDFCEVGVAFVMGWGMFKGILINLGLIYIYIYIYIFFFWGGQNLGLFFISL